MSFLDQEVERIRLSGALGRSAVYGKLLAYLKDTTERGTPPREIDIAVDVLERRDFDPTTDSSVRVYLHKLRQKLEHYYVRDGNATAQFIFIPRGEYTLQLGCRADQPRAATRGGRPRYLAAAAGAAMALLLVVATAPERFRPAEARAAGNTPIWQPILESDRQLVVVLGDYYLFAEVDEDRVTRRLIRDFRIDSREDLDTGYRDAAAPERSFVDIRLSYLPLGTASALAEILEVIHSTRKTPIVVPESQLDIQTVRSSDIVYLGYLSGLGILSEFVFASSRFALGPTYDELTDKSSGEVYLSEAGFLDGPAIDYLDYGLVSAFAGPEDNRILIMAGMRDEGLMQMASLLSSRESIEDLLARLPDAAGTIPSMEALYRVRGMHRMNVASKLLFASALDPDRIWIDAPATRLSISSLPVSGNVVE